MKTVSPGRRLTLPAPARIALRLVDDMPLRLLTTLPVSLIDSGSLNRRGGAKSRAVNVPDLRSKCLDNVRYVVLNMHLRFYLRAG